MNSPFIAHITGNPNITTMSSINVRAQPGTGTTVAVLFQAPIGTANLPILDVQPDQANIALNGKVYQWFKVTFSNGQAGWVRDDLISLQGDGRHFGYPVLTQEAYAFGLLRQLLPTTSPTPAPAPIPAPPPVTPPPPAPAPAPIPTPTGVVTGTIISNNGLNLRATPVNGNVITRLPYLEKIKILGAQAQSGTAYHWAQVQALEGSGWVRTDFLSISGDASAFGLSKGDEYPAPLHNYWWVRGQNDVQPNGSVDQHLGWDFSANAGESIRCGPNGGLVTKINTCTKCTAAQPSSIQQGHPVNDPAVLNDPAWGFGFGNAVQVRYTNDLLPASTKDRLAKAGLSGGHLFVIYAHMSSINVQAGQQISAFGTLGIIGNTGNSTAQHLHLEVHASLNANDTNFGGMREFDPEILFLR